MGLLRRNASVLFASISTYALGFVLFVTAVQFFGLQMSDVSAFTRLVESPTMDGSWFVILKTNVAVDLLLVGGGLLLGVPTMVHLLLNGASLGVMLTLFPSEFTVLELVAAIAPHAIFEIPSLWLGGAAGLVLPRELVRYLRAEQTDIITRDAVGDVMRLAAVALLLVVVGAGVEAFVTPTIADYV